MAIDMHAHWSPRGLIRETAAGRDWYGWRIFRDHDGREHVSQGQHVLPFAASKLKRTRASSSRTCCSPARSGTITWTKRRRRASAAKSTKSSPRWRRRIPIVRGMAVLPMQHQKLALGGWIHFGVGRLNLRSLDMLKKRAGADHIMIGTDYPAGGNIPGGAVPWIENCTFLAAAEKQDILWRNAARFLGLGPDSPFMRQHR